MTATALLRQHAEQQYAEELAALTKADDRPRPSGWALSPWSVRLYLLGGKLPNGFQVSAKYIGNARLAGMEASLGMSASGAEYNMSLTIFFIGYALAEPVTNAMLKRTTPRIFFTSIVVLWGVVMTLTGLCQNYAGLLAARWFLGITEAGLYPGKSHTVMESVPVFLRSFFTNRRQLLLVMLV